IGSFGDHGGSTSTVPLLPGSPALDGGNPALLFGATDQRGFPRVVNNLPDIGADERQPTRITLVAPQIAATINTIFSAAVNTTFATPFQVRLTDDGTPAAGM